MAKALIYKNGVATYAELPDIEPSAEDIRAGYLSEIESLKSQLFEFDYKAIKFAEGELSATDYEPIRIQRRALRQRINELEESLGQAQSEPLPTLMLHQEDNIITTDTEVQPSNIKAKA